MIHKASPAKVNLFLQVLGKRDDGYHELATLMQKIDLSDRMDFEPGGEGIRIECPGSRLPADESNIAFRAASALFARVSDHPGIRIVIHKQIPVGAGLGGGSSNAATVLMTLNDHFGYRLGSTELIGLGEKIGADVPFFLFDGPAWAFGKGEKLESAVIPPMWLVLINPGFEVSTKSVYEGLNLKLTKDSLKFNIPRFSSLQEIARGFRNDLEKVTLGLHPILADLKHLLAGCGALGTLMSGSGPTVFGLFEKEMDAEEAAAKMKKAGNWSVFKARSLPG